MRRLQRVELGRWHATFEPRDIDIAGNDTVVLTEVWGRNDYRVHEEWGLSGTVVDIGANIGAFTVLASLAGADRVIAIEPNAENFTRLCEHTKRNWCDNVDLRNLAVAPPEIESVTMVGEGGGSVAVDVREGDVPTIDLHHLIDEHAPISFLKMDIEGAEFAVFDALPVEQLAYVDRIAMEWHGPASPHLRHLRGDEFGPLVTKLADAGRVETNGHPAFGGLLYWARY